MFFKLSARRVLEVSFTSQPLLPLVKEQNVHIGQQVLLLNESFWSRKEI